MIKQWVNSENGKMKVVATVIILIILALWVNAHRTPTWVNVDQPLSREFIRSHYAVSAELRNIKLDHPDLFGRPDLFDAPKVREHIIVLQASEQYPEIRAALSSGGYRDLKQYFDVSLRLMAAWFATQTRKGHISDQANRIENSIKSMKQSGVPASITADMEIYLTKQKAMVTAIKDVNLEDKKFIRDNYNWMMGLRP